MANSKTSGYGSLAKTPWSEMSDEVLQERVISLLTTMRDDAMKCLGTVNCLDQHHSRDGRKHILATLKGWSNRFLSNAIDVGLILSAMTKR